MSHKSTKSAAKAALGRAAGSENKEKNKHITKITAKPSAEAKAPVEPAKSDQKPAKTGQKPAKLDQKAAKSAAKNAKKAKKSSEEKPLKEVFILARPFVALGRYIRDSWREIRRVRWPNRKVTWKMTLAVLVYCAIFMVLILLLDTLFTFLFNSIIQK